MPGKRRLWLDLAAADDVSLQELGSKKRSDMDEGKPCLAEGSSLFAYTVLLVGLESVPPWLVDLHLLMG